MTNQPESSSQEARVKLFNITKRYHKLVANDHINLEVHPGEIHAVLGENGAGKSTLMKILYGAVQADEGEILWNGRQVTIASPEEARKLGIGMVFQHFSLFETLTVVENIALVLDEPFDLSALSKRVKDVSEKYGLPLQPERLVHSLSVGERQRVEIVRCLLQNPKLLILDEPTSVLTPQAVEKLFETLRQLASEGVSILYISHKLHEIQSLCDTATIIRAGKVTGNASPKKETPASLARMMIGREMPECELPTYTGETHDVLVVNKLTLPASNPFGTSLHEISLTVHAGEILGIAGISGNGQNELMAALSGETRSEANSVLLDGKPIGNLGTRVRRDMGLAFVPEERLGRGAVPGLSLVKNTLLTAHRQGLVRTGIVRYKAASEVASDIINRFDVKCSGIHAPARSLSGGNLQKFIVGREMVQMPRMLLVSQPTWGVDVGAAAQLRQTLINLSRQGIAVLVVSEELEELFEISDRIAVINSGRLNEPQRRQDTNSEAIGLLMGGRQQTNISDTQQSA